MKIARKHHPDEHEIDHLDYGCPFESQGVLYARVNPGVHLHADFGWGVNLESGLLTRFGPTTMVREVVGEFVPE